jgi:hypothetical protein
VISKRSDSCISQESYADSRCFRCNKWYHYGCVGVSMGDDSLKDDASFTCPPCSVTEAW